MSVLLRKTDNLGRRVVPLIFRRMRNFIFCLLIAFVTIVAYLAVLVCLRRRSRAPPPTSTHFFNLFTSRLTSFLTDHLADIPYALALVRLGFTQATDLCSHLSDQLFVRTFQRDLGVFAFLLRCGQFQLLGDLEYDIMRVAQCEVQYIPLVGCLETDTDQLQLPLITLCNAFHHIGYEGAIEAMQRPMTDLVGRTREFD